MDDKMEVGNVGSKKRKVKERIKNQVKQKKRLSIRRDISGCGLDDRASILARVKFFSSPPRPSILLWNCYRPFSKVLNWLEHEDNNLNWRWRLHTLLVLLCVLKQRETSFLLVIRRWYSLVFWTWIRSFLRYFNGMWLSNIYRERHEGWFLDLIGSFCFSWFYVSRTAATKPQNEAPK